MSKPTLLVTRAIFPETLARLAQHFEVDDNQADEVWTQDQLIAKLQGKFAALTTGSEKIDGKLLSACPDLKICANMAVGFNNFDVPAMQAAGVRATNTPDVLTETTADFGFALLLATARRMTESEHYLRAGKWTKWSYDQFVGSEVHGSTLGILGMGRIGQGIAKRGAFGFGMKVIYHNRSRLSAELEAQCQASYVSKTELLQSADHLVLVLPFSPEARHTIGCGRAGANETHSHPHQHRARRYCGRWGFGASLKEPHHRGGGFGRVRRRTQSPPRFAHRPQRSPNPPHSQRHSQNPYGNGQFGGG
jgi:gluconate 2-dehydrogenase